MTINVDRRNAPSRGQRFLRQLPAAGGNLYLCICRKVEKRPKQPYVTLHCEVIKQVQGINHDSIRQLS